MNQSQAERVVSCVGNLIVAGKDGSPIEDWNHARQRLIAALTTEPNHSEQRESATVAPNSSVESPDSEAVRLLRAWEVWWGKGESPVPVGETRAYLASVDRPRVEPSSVDQQKGGA